MGFRDNEEALRARIEELESKLASSDAGEMAKQLNDTMKELKDAKRKLSHALDARDKAIEDHRRLAAKRTAAPWISAAMFQRSGVFGIGAGAAFAAIAGAVMFFGWAIRSCPVEPFHAGYIVDRVHHLAYSTSDTVCTGTGDARRCHVETTFHEQRWTVIVANGDREVEDELSHDRWLPTQNGQWYCVLDPCPPAPGPEDFEELPR